MVLVIAMQTWEGKFISNFGAANIQSTAMDCVLGIYCQHFIFTILLESK